jgi:type IV secretory pathway VirB10-like protein
MESGSSYRVYRSSDLHSIPPTAISKRSHTADDGVGWSGFAFLVAVGIAIGGASFAAMHVVKPDLTPAAAPMTVTAPTPVPMPAIDPPPAANKAEPVVIAPPASASAEPQVQVHAKPDAKPKPRVEPRRRAPKPTRTESAPTNPYDATTVDRGLPPAL